jgi:hypothetical protein
LHLRITPACAKSRLRDAGGSFEVKDFASYLKHSLFFGEAILCPPTVILWRFRDGFLISIPYSLR